MQRIKKLVAVIGKYTKDGEEKNQYHNCGAMFKREDGSFCLKLDALPLGEFNGWVNIYDLDPPKGAQTASPKPQDAHAATTVDGGFDDDIPFSNYELRTWA